MAVNIKYVFAKDLIFFRKIGISTNDAWFYGAIGDPYLPRDLKEEIVHDPLKSYAATMDFLSRYVYAQGYGEFIIYTDIFRYSAVELHQKMYKKGGCLDV